MEKEETVYVNYDPTHEQLKNIGHGLIELEDKNTSFILCFVNKKNEEKCEATCIVGGNDNQLGNLLMHMADDSERFADLIVECAKILQVRKMPEILQKFLKSLGESDDDEEHK